MVSSVEFDYLKKTDFEIRTRTYKITASCYHELIQEILKTEKEENIIIIDKKKLIREILK